MGSIVPNFRWNILNYGRVLNNVRLEQARTLELIATYQNTVLTAGRETQTALRGFHKTRERADDLARARHSGSGGDPARPGTVPHGHRALQHGVQPGNDPGAAAGSIGGGPREHCAQLDRGLPRGRRRLGAAARAVGKPAGRHSPRQELVGVPGESNPGHILERLPPPTAGLLEESFETGSA